MISKITINDESYDLETFSIPNDNSPMSKFNTYGIIKDFKINECKGEETKFLKGTYFPICTTNQIFHNINYSIAYFEYLKKYIPDLKPYMPNMYLRTMQGVFKDVADFYEIPDYDRLNGSESFVVENFVFLPQALGFEFAGISDNFFELIYKIRRHGTQMYDVHSYNTKVVKDVFKDCLHEDPNKPKKIFITRSYANFMKKDFDLFSKTRFIDYEYYLSVEAEFMNRGYALVSMENLSLFEQMSLFYNATHVAGFSGSNIYNAIWCKPGTKVYDLEIPRELPYDWNWDRVFGDIGLRQEKIIVSKSLDEIKNIE